MFTSTTLFAETAVIQIGVVESVLGIVAVVLSVGIAWGTLKNSVSNITGDVKDLKTDMKDVRERFAALEGKSSGLYQSHSPISLTEPGQKVLDESGLKDFIDVHKEILVNACDSDGRMRTPYDVQECVFDFMDSLQFPQDVDDKVKTYAFSQGLRADVVRRVGAIYLRDICLDLKGFSLEDIEK